LKFSQYNLSDCKDIKKGGLMWSKR